MLMRVYVVVALGCLLLASCDRRGASGKKARAPGMSSVTLHVDNMTERQKLT